MTNQTSQTNGQTRESTPGIDQVRTPLLAALGAGNLASQAVVDAVNKARERVNEGTESARKNFGDVPTDIESLRGRLDPAELRKVLDEYTDAAWKLYNRLAESGEEAWDNVAEQPQVRRALQQLEEALATAQGRAEGVATEARGRVDDVLGLVTKRTRSSGEKTARAVQEAASDAAAKVEDLGDDIAQETRSSTRKAANKTAAQQSSGPATKSSTASSGSTGSGSSGSTGSASTGSGSKSSGSTSKSGGSTSRSTGSAGSNGSSGTRKNTSGGSSSNK